MPKLIQSGNSKLHNQYMFNLPASIEVCGRPICKSCYAYREQLRYPSIVAARESRLLAAQQPDFASRIISEISNIRKPFVAFRVHSSGEFFSQEYVDNWATIASSLPHIRFYAFTKRLADFDFTPLSSLPNFTLINSLQSGGLNYGKAIDLPSNIYVCPATTSSSRCGIDCSWCWSKCAQHFGVSFVKH